MATLITDIKVVATAPEGINLLVVKIETNQPGRVGLGCATFAYRHLAVQCLIEQYLRPLLVGRDADAIEELWQLMHQNAYWRNGPIENNAISGIDMALWDIKGKRAGMPLYQLFGGKVREGVAIYRHADGADLAELCDNIQRYREQGITHIRCQSGGYGGGRYGKAPAHAPEASLDGIIEEAGAGVAGLAVGDRIAVCPSRPCGACRFCQLGLQNHCLDMRYYGSAMRMPHVQGAFRQEIVIEASQAHPLADGVSDAEGAMAEPLAVALHAVNRAGPLLGRSVLVTGCGPIGALAVIAARRAGATHIVATDVVTQPLRKVAKVGADETLNVAEQPDALARYAADKGQFDVVLEASGNERALRSAFDVLRPRGVIVQLGLAATEMTLPLNTVVAKEFDLRGAFRFHEKFGVAVRLINQRLVDLTPLISATLSYRDAGRAFALAADRSQSMKVLLNFD